MAITTLYCTGFEHGLLSVSGAGLFSSTQGAPTIINTAPRNGSFHARLSAILNTAINARWLLASGQAKLVTRIAIKLSSRPSSAAGLYFSEATSFIWLNTDANGVLGLGTAATTQTVTASAAIDTTNYHVVEIQADMSANPWVVDWKIDGVPQTRFSPALAASSITRVALGTNSTTGPAYTCDYDDWIIGSFTAATDWYGDGRGLSYLPGSDGVHSFTTNDFSPGDAGAQQAPSWSTAWQNVSDAPPWTATRSTTDNIAQRVANTAGYVEVVSAPSVEVGPANAVRALLGYSSSGTTANTMGCVARNGDGTPVVIFGDLPVAQGGLGGALADYSEATNFFVAAMVPAPTVGWFATEIGMVAWRIGGSNAVSPIPTAQMLMLEVDWPSLATTGPAFQAIPFMPVTQSQ